MDLFTTTERRGYSTWLTEGQIRFDARLVGFIEDLHFAKLTFALCPLQTKKVPAGRTRAQDLAAGGDFEPLGDGLACFAA